MRGWRAGHAPYASCSAASGSSGLGSSSESTRCPSRPLPQLERCCFGWVNREDLSWTRPRPPLQAVFDSSPPGPVTVLTGVGRGQWRMATNPGVCRHSEGPCSPLPDPQDGPFSPSSPSVCAQSSCGAGRPSPLPLQPLSSRYQRSVFPRASLTSFCTKKRASRVVQLHLGCCSDKSPGCWEDS